VNYRGKALHRREYVPKLVPAMALRLYSDAPARFDFAVPSAKLTTSH
jgi:hypothetical protein